MEIGITFEEAKKSHPEEVRKIIAELRSSKSKSKNSPEGVIQWSYSWSERARGYTIAEVLSGATGTRTKEPETFEEYWAERERNIFCYLRGSVGKWFGVGNKNGEVPPKLAKIPEVVREYYRKCFEKDLAERRRVAALTPEEKDKEIKEMLKQLGQSGGFFSIQVPRR